jgi:hypothetical protein
MSLEHADLRRCLKAVERYRPLQGLSDVSADDVVKALSNDVCTNFVSRTLFTRAALASQSCPCGRKRGLQRSHTTPRPTILKLAVQALRLDRPAGSHSVADIMMRFARLHADPRHRVRFLCASCHKDESSS